MCRGYAGAQKKLCNPTIQQQDIYLAPPQNFNQVHSTIFKPENNGPLWTEELERETKQLDSLIEGETTTHKAIHISRVSSTPHCCWYRICAEDVDGKLHGLWGGGNFAAIHGTRDGDFSRPNTKVPLWVQLAGEGIECSRGCAKNTYCLVLLKDKKGKDKFCSAAVKCLSREKVLTCERIRMFPRRARAYINAYFKLWLDQQNTATVQGDKQVITSDPVSIEKM